MNIKEITPQDLKRFLLLFLPEYTLNKKMPQLELSTLAETTKKALKLIGLTTTIDALFEAFKDLSYSISVIEPQRENSNEKPYSDTNSHKIYIGIDTAKLRKLSSIPADVYNSDSTILISLQEYAGSIKK